MVWPRIHTKTNSLVAIKTMVHQFAGACYCIRRADVLLAGARACGSGTGLWEGWGSKLTIEVSVEPSNLMSGCLTLPGGSVCAVDVDCAASAGYQ
jgi:hypothetical protein